MSRSTAPTITSPLEAWPAKASPRTSPLSSKVSSLSSSPTRDGTTFYDSRETSETSISSTMTRGESSKMASGRLGSASSSQRSLNGTTRELGPNPSSNPISTPPPRLRLVKGSLEDDPQSTGEGSTNGPESGLRSYAPPRRPLTPGQLGRIAQSFGIVIPSLPHPSPTTASLSPFQTVHRSPMTMTRELRGTPWLITVIPPFSILLPLLPTTTPDPGPSKLGSPEATRERERKKRWKRGRLLPLQPTMGSMLLSIAREYGLPSTQGINLYLVHQPLTHLSAAPGHTHSNSISSNGSFGSNFEEATGPQISAQTWSTLFATYLVSSASSSRASTPAHTPLKSSGPLGRDIPFPPSPLSLADPPRAGPSQPKLSPSSSASSSGHSSASLDVPDRLPPTPHSLGQFPASPQTNPIVGSIEFDVDPDQAGWYDEWRRTARQRPSHSRKISSASDSGLAAAYGRPPVSASLGYGGIRQLNLVRKVNDGRGTARFLKDLEGSRWTEKPRSMSLSASGSGSRPRVEPLPEERILVEDGDKADLSSLLGPPRDGMLSRGADTVDLGDPTDLLASPIALDRQAVNALDIGRVREVMQEALRNGEGEKRGSGLVMADELDRLEQIMRNLSPREIRVTSPRALTPRMAAKIAAAKIQADSLHKMPSLSPSVPQHSTLLPSPLASGFTAETSGAAPATSSYLSSRPSKSSTDSASTTNSADKKTPLSAWPAVPYAASPESPRIDEYFQPKLPSRSDAPTPRSAETLQRGQHSTSPNTSTERFSEWRPARPHRPASPGLEQGHQRNMSYTLSAGHVDLLRQNTTGHIAAQPLHARDRSISSPITHAPRDIRVSPSGGIGESPRSPPQPREKGRSGSISFRELRHQLSSRSMNARRGDKISPQAPEVTSLARGAIDEETVGLFKPSTVTQPSSFAGLSNPGPTTSTPGPVVPSKQPHPFDLSPPLQMSEWGMTEVPSPPTHTFSSDIIPLPTAQARPIPQALQNREPNSSSLPASGKALASKILGGMNGFTFGKKPSISSLRQLPPTSGNRSVSTGQPEIRPTVTGHTRTFSGSKSRSRRHPSNGSITISSPITSTFRQVEGTSPQFTLGQFSEPVGVGRFKDGRMESPPFSAASAVSGTSGTSTELPYRSPPRQHTGPGYPVGQKGEVDRALRKAVHVPGDHFPESESFASSRSFVLEDPPKRRVR